jgi:hypothetical protein
MSYAKILLNKPFNYIKEKIFRYFLDIIISRIRTFFFIDFSKKSLLEVIFFLSIIIILLISIYYPSFKPRDLIIFIVLSWASLALLGFFIPTIKHHFIFLHPGPVQPGIPILFQIKSKGGFIAGKKIKVFAKILNIHRDRDSKQEFLNYYDEFSIVCLASIALPIKAGKFLQGMPEAGGLKIDMKKCKGKGNILFNSPGSYRLRTFCKKMGDSTRLYSDELKDRQHILRVSPSETYVSLRNNQIMYSLTLVVLLITILQLKII